MPLFFDTETTGVPLKYDAPTSDLANWPRLVQLAWLLTDDAGSEIRSAEYIVRPDGFTIPEAAARVHGIGTDRALRDGVELSTVLAAVIPDFERADLLVAHNIQFDEKILGAELLRAGHADLPASKSKRCTMRESTDFCGLPGRYGYKWPKLQELHMKLFGEAFAGAHQALVDVRACARCYFELKRLGVMA